MNRRSDHRTGETGIAMLELLVAAPFLLVLVIGVIDVGRLLNQYLLLNYAVSSGVRFAMSQPDLAAGPFVGGTPNQTCPTGWGAPATAQTHHQEIHERVRDIVNLANEALNTSYCIRSTLQIQPTMTDDPREKTVSIELYAAYRAFFPLLNGLPMTVRATGPYLLAGR